MILRRVMTRSTIKTMTVQKVYEVDGQPKADLLDDNGVLFEGCSIMGQGGENLDFLIIPEQDQDVLTISEYGDNPYIIAVFSSQEDYTEQVQLNSAGEHPTNAHDIKNTRLKNQNTQIILTPGKIYNTAPTRIQNTLEVSNGAQPAQSAAIAESLLEDLASYQTAINQLKAKLDTLLASLTALQGPLAPVAAAAAPANALPGTQAPTPNPAIKSELIKTER